MLLSIKCYFVDFRSDPLCHINMFVLKIKVKTQLVVIFKMCSNEKEAFTCVHQKVPEFIILILYK